MRAKLVFVSFFLLLSVLAACGTNDNNQQPNDMNYQPTQYDNQQNQNGDDLVPDLETPLDRDENEPDLGEEPSEERGNQNGNNGNQNGNDGDRIENEDE